MWKPTTLQAIVDAKALAIYTSQIVRNNKTFKQEDDFNNDLRTLLVHTARDIYIISFNANGIPSRAGETSEALFRRRLDEQVVAIKRCGGKCFC